MKVFIDQNYVLTYIINVYEHIVSIESDDMPKFFPLTVQTRFGIRKSLSRRTLVSSIKDVIEEIVIFFYCTICSTN
jgi:hypothetical protein